METEATLSSIWDQHLASEFAAKSPEQARATLDELSRGAAGLRGAYRADRITLFWRYASQARRVCGG
jgi:hypothetical protein